MAAPDWALAHAQYVSDPVTRFVLCTPSDGADQPFATTALYIPVAGNVAFTTVGGDSPGVVPLTAGYHPIRCNRILATGTAVAVYICSA
jgi:hypothetical protein